MAQFVTLTRSNNVTAVDFAWQDDYVIEGPGGLGWAHASFDQGRYGTATLVLDNREVVQVEVHSEAFDIIEVGEVWTRVLLAPKGSLDVAGNIAHDDIPF